MIQCNNSNSFIMGMASLKLNHIIELGIKSVEILIKIFHQNKELIPKLLSLLNLLSNCMDDIFL